MEMAGADMQSPLAPIRWASYLVLAVWALYIAQSDQNTNTMILVSTAIGFFASLSLIEAVFGAEVSAFDFTTTFGLVMMLGVLVGTLAAGSRLVWAGGVAVRLIIWSVAMGILIGPIIAALFITVWEIFGATFANVLPHRGAPAAAAAATSAAEPETR